VLMGAANVEHCGGTVIVHDDRTFTCSNGLCVVAASVEAIVSRHVRFVACRKVFGEEGCPKCGWHLFPPMTLGPEQTL